MRVLDTILLRKYDWRLRLIEYSFITASPVLLYFLAFGFNWLNVALFFGVAGLNSIRLYADRKSRNYYR